MHHDPPRDEPRIFTGVDHLGQPIKRRVRIAASHRLYERRNRIVMGVFIVVDNGLFLDALLGRRQVDVNKPVAAWFGSQRRNLQRVQSLSRVAVRQLRQMM